MDRCKACNIKCSKTGFSQGVNNNSKEKNLRFAIARKIGANGTVPTGFVKQALASAMEKLKIEEPIIQDIEENIVEILTKAGFKEMAEGEFILNIE